MDRRGRRQRAAAGADGLPLRYAGRMARQLLDPGQDHAQPCQARRALGLASSEFIVLQLGRMVPRKGVDNVIRALALMGSAKRAVRLVVVGGNSAAPDEAATPELGRLRAVMARVEELAGHLPGGPPGQAIGAYVGSLPPAAPVHGSRHDGDA